MVIETDLAVVVVTMLVAQVGLEGGYATFMADLDVPGSVVERHDGRDVLFK